MNINNLEVDMVIKNYRELCDILEEKVKTGDGKVYQLKELQRFINYNKEGNKFIIKEIYDEPKDKIDNRKLGNGGIPLVEYPNLLIKKEDYNKIGVYYIIEDNNIYIGSTVSGFRKRFMEHLNNNKDAYTKHMLKNKGTFHILWNSDVVDEFIVRYLENYLIEYFKANSDYNVVNIKQAHSYEKKYEPKYKTIRIKVDEMEYENTLKLLSELGLV